MISIGVAERDRGNNQKLGKARKLSERKISKPSRFFSPIFLEDHPCATVLSDRALARQSAKVQLFIKSRMRQSAKLQYLPGLRGKR
jgi:hypothetical protein|tara:strand:+ start:628 stop:885 length:258 start_codon:yes stop_codon:yes gene_type:complete